MPIEPVLVYLDNQDFSNMANSNRHVNEPDLPVLLDQLREFRDSGNVKFVFSGVGVAEALPMGPGDLQLSIRHVRLLRELCGDNALISDLRLKELELGNLQRRTTDTIEVLAGKFDWMPPNLERELGIRSDAKSVEDQAKELLTASGMNARLQVEALPMTARMLRDGLLKRRQERIDAGDFRHLQSRFHDIVLRAAVGEASMEEKRTAFLESWNDLEWIVGFYDNLPELVDWYRDLVRKPSSWAAEALRTLVVLLQGREMPQEMGRKGWKGLRDVHLMQIEAALATSVGLPHGHFQPEEFLRHCPGISAEAGVLYSFVWTYLAGAAKKEIPNSAAADAMHAVYAPYVDIFRTDRSMAPHVTQALEGMGTRVIGSRRLLAEAITELLRSRGWE
jgi:hypothetical protein